MADSLPSPTKSACTSASINGAAISVRAARAANAGKSVLKDVVKQTIQKTRLDLAIHDQATVNQTIDLQFCPSRLLHILLVLMSVSVITTGNLDIYTSVAMMVLAVVVLVLCLYLDSRASIDVPCAELASFESTTRALPASSESTNASSSTISVRSLASYGVAAQLTCVVCCEFMMDMSHTLLFLCLVTSAVLYFQIFRFYMQKAYMDKNYTHQFLFCILVVSTTVIVSASISIPTSTMNLCAKLLILILWQ